MLMLLLTILGTALVIGFFIGAWNYVHAWHQFRGQRLVLCPDNDSYAAVKVDPKHAAATALRNDLDLRLNACSRWPEKETCQQECLAQIEAAPMECRVRNILRGWYEAGSCVFCHKSIGPIDWKSHEPALLSPEHRIVTWREVRAETLPAVLVSHWPVCWDCSVIERLFYSHPEKVTLRPEHRSPGILPIV